MTWRRSEHQRSTPGSSSVSRSQLTPPWGAQRALSPLLCLLLFFTGSLLLSSCQDGGEGAREEEELEGQFGLPGKGDLSCDPKSRLCWGAEAAGEARALMERERTFLLGEQSREDYFRQIERLSAKLDEAARGRLAALRGEEGARLSDEALVRALFSEVYGQLLAGYWSAHVTVLSPSLSEALEADEPMRTLTGGAAEKEDGSSGSFPNALPVSRKLRPAFEALWAQGPLGQYLATMLSLSGIPELDWDLSPLEDRELLDGEGIDREGAQLIERYARYAALDSVFASLQASIPIAGFFISVPYGVYAQFKHRAHLTFMLARLYGLDPSEPDDFLLTTQLFAAAQGFRELLGATIKTLAGRQTYRLLSERSPELLPERFSQRRVQELVQANLAQLGVYGLRILANLTRGAAKGSMKALLGQITFGVAALADVTIDYFNAQVIGREVHHALHPWGWALYLESGEALRQPRLRRCAYLTLSALITADGRVSRGEVELLRDAIARPTYYQGIIPEYTVLRSTRGGGGWSALTEPEQILAELEAALQLAEEGGLSCLEREWGGRPSFEQLSLAAWARLAVYSDGARSQEEEAWFEALIERLPVRTEEERVYYDMLDRVDEFIHSVPSFIDTLWIWGYLSDEARAALEGDALLDGLSAQLHRLRL